MANTLFNRAVNEQQQPTPKQLKSSQVTNKAPSSNGILGSPLITKNIKAMAERPNPRNPKADAGDLSLGFKTKNARAGSLQPSSFTPVIKPTSKFAVDFNDVMARQKNISSEYGLAGKGLAYKPAQKSYVPRV